MFILVRTSFKPHENYMDWKAILKIVRNDKNKHYD